jgi:hypothetical protein
MHSPHNKELSDPKCQMLMLRNMCSCICFPFSMVLEIESDPSHARQAFYHWFYHWAVTQASPFTMVLVFKKNWLAFFVCSFGCRARDQTEVLAHTRQVLYQWAIPPDTLFFGESISLCSPCWAWTLNPPASASWVLRLLAYQFLTIIYIFWIQVLCLIYIYIKHVFFQSVAYLFIVLMVSFEHLNFLILMWSNLAIFL